MQEEEQQQKEPLKNDPSSPPLKKESFESTATPPLDEKGGSRLAKIEQRIAQLEAQKKAILAREKEKERKVRTRRLIQIGALSLKYLKLPDEIEPADYEKVMQRVLVVLNARTSEPAN